MRKPQKCVSWPAVCYVLENKSRDFLCHSRLATGKINLFYLPYCDFQPNIPEAATFSLQCQVQSPRTNFLHKLSLQVQRSQNASETLKKLHLALTSQDTKKFGAVTHFTTAEIQYAANTMANLQHNILHDADLPVIANITNAILRSSTKEIHNDVSENKMAQGVSNASNIILDSIDNMLNKIKLNCKGKLIETLTYHTCA